MSRNKKKPTPEQEAERYRLHSEEMQAERLREPLTRQKLIEIVGLALIGAGSKSSPALRRLLDALQ